MYCCKLLKIDPIKIIGIVEAVNDQLNLADVTIFPFANASCATFPNPPT